MALVVGVYPELSSALQVLPPKSLGEQRDRLSQQGGTGGALEPAALTVSIPLSSAARATAHLDW